MKAIRFCLLAAALCIPALAAEPPTLDEALSRLYSFDFPGAHAALDRYIAVHPTEALPYAFRSSAYLFYELDRLEVLESEFLMDDDRLVAKSRPNPDPNIRKLFMASLDDAQRRAEAALKVNPNDRSALFAMVVASGVATDYMALVEKKQMSSLSPAKRGNSYAQRLLKLDPSFYDAYLTSGFSEYMVGSLPFFIRWFVHFDSVEGDKQRGVHQLEMVASKGHYLKPLAKVFLGIIDLREKRPREAQKLLSELARDYPENKLYRKELDKLNAKLGASAN
jgi:tetratricopeptide (TPR) repeat protein